MLDINPEWTLLSNNPDKIKGMKSIGLITSIESLEVPPNPFNYEYLLSKQQSAFVMKVKESFKTFYTTYSSICL